MAATPDTSLPPRRATWREAMAVYLQRRVLIVLFLGFSSGLPLALSGSTLLVWMRESGVDLGTIGLFALVGTPYTLKFLWAPLVDALHVPLLTKLLGRRRGWLVFAQLLLMVAILLLALTDPAKSPFYVALGALLVAAASATQDIVVDAFRVESLPESEQAAGMASYVAAYRIGMLVSTAGALFMVSAFEGTGLPRTSAWMWGYVAMAGLVLIGTVTALLATEPDQSRRAEEAKTGESAFVRVTHAAVGAFSEFLTRKDAWAVLAVVVLYTIMPPSSKVSVWPQPCLADSPAASSRVPIRCQRVSGSVAYCRRLPISRSHGSRWSASINGHWRSPSQRKISPAPSVP
jgi:PAT family beta-lactamase induction signal transducer AmpG